MGAVSARIAEIQARLTIVSSPPRLAVSTPSGPVATSTTPGSAFSDALASAVSTTAAATTTTNPSASTVSTGQLNAAGAPSELAQYGNGRVPASALERLGDGNHQLWSPAAQAYQRLTAAAKRAGVHIGITDSYRSYDNQVDLARRKGLHSQGGLAAKPGTSDHGWGKSLDLRLDATAQRWMRGHAGEFGFSENVSREPWHWTYRAGG